MKAGGTNPPAALKAHRTESRRRTIRWCKTLPKS